MPLKHSTSKKAFEKNVKTEDKRLKEKGVPAKSAQKQAVAVAFGEKREAAAKKGAVTRKKDDMKKGKC